MFLVIATNAKNVTLYTRCTRYRTVALWRCQHVPFNGGKNVFFYLCFLEATKVTSSNDSVTFARMVLCA